MLTNLGGPFNSFNLSPCSFDVTVLDSEEGIKVQTLFEVFHYCDPMVNLISDWKKIKQFTINRINLR